MANARQPTTADALPTQAGFDWARIASTDLDGFKVALVHPFLAEAHSKNRLRYRESLALGYLSAALRTQGIEVLYLNAELRTLGPQQVARLILADPQVGLVGISSKSQRTYAAAAALGRLLKEARPELHITVGGVFPTAADEIVLRDCEFIDSVVRGEGEAPIVELAHTVALGLDLAALTGLTFRRDGRLVRTPNRPRVADLDSLAFPDRCDLEWVLEHGGEAEASAYLVASRGCYASCTFCSIHQIYGDHLVMRRSPGSIVSEMESIIERYGIHRFSFVDDLFIMPSKQGIRWVHDFCDEIEKRGVDVNFYVEMRADTVEAPLVKRLMDVGLYGLFVGIESGCDSVLKRWDKGVTRKQNDACVKTLLGLGVKRHWINFGYIMFGPEMSLAELNEQYKWIRESGYCTVANLQNKMNIYWGTPQHRRMLARGKTDAGPVGARWNYEIEDPAVRAIERRIRRFHERFEAEQAKEYLEAREAFRRQIKSDGGGTAGAPAWVGEVLSQARSRIEETEREAYYYVFENYIGWANQGRRIEELEESAVWDRLQPLFAQLRRDSLLLQSLLASLSQTRWIDSAAEGAPGTGWLSEDGSTGCIWILGGSRRSGLGYRARFPVVYRDRCDHRCEVVTFDLPRGENAGSRETLLESLRAKRLQHFAAVSYALDTEGYATDAGA